MKTQVFYDGACSVCRNEVHHYQKQEGSEKIQWIDIAATGFNPKQYALDPKAIHEKMHVRKANGDLVAGVKGFVAIWENLPKYQWAARIAQWPGIYQAMSVGYVLFAKARPYLFRTALSKTHPCEDDSCKIRK